MKPSIPAFFQELLASPQPPCVSIYQALARVGSPPGATNARGLEELIKTADEQLRQKYPAQDRAMLLKNLNELRRDEVFWQTPSESLAIFSSPTVWQVHRLLRPVRQMVEVADSFHIKHLIRAHQFEGKFQVLCLSQRNVRLLEGNQDRLDPIPLRGVPRNVGEAVQGQITEDILTSSSEDVTVKTQKYNTISEKTGATDNDLDIFFRAVDQAVWENHSRPSGLPLIVCALEQHHNRFFGLAKNQNLVQKGIRINPDVATIDQIRAEAWKIVEPDYRKRLEQVIEEYGLARSRQLGSDDLMQVAEAATFSRVGLLLVSEEKHIGGRIDASGKVQLGDLSSPDTDDLLDDIAERVLKTGGQVLVMRQNQMPSDTGIAAIYRF